MTTASNFGWDDGNRAKWEKHGVSIGEIEDLLRGSPLVAPDVKHPQTEQRFLAVGRNAEGRPIFVVFTWRGTSHGRIIRPLSARYMHVGEAARYEASSGI
ncbi:MAG: BrnT family toxin [Methylobacterium sp.]|uniref:BrnT family toxin n=1 Tax=Methylobacterium sp. TaxID=409 RepID=UPI0025F24342|nr:BrnT family toxin [Methylobacterium sp.]MBX9932775.1 BrnT family toxin [Methylobacterium sp.]